MRGPTGSTRRCSAGLIAMARDARPCGRVTAVRRVTLLCVITPRSTIARRRRLCEPFGSARERLGGAPTTIRGSCGDQRHHVLQRLRRDEADVPHEVRDRLGAEARAAASTRRGPAADRRRAGAISLVNHPLSCSPVLRCFCSRSFVLTMHRMASVALAAPVYRKARRISAFASSRVQMAPGSDRLTAPTAAKGGSVQAVKIEAARAASTASGMASRIRSKE